MNEGIIDFVCIERWSEEIEVYTRRDRMNKICVIEFHINCILKINFFKDNFMHL